MMDTISKVNIQKYIDKKRKCFSKYFKTTKPIVKEKENDA